MVAGPDFTPLAVSHFFPSQKEGASLEPWRYWWRRDAEYTPPYHRISPFALGTSRRGGIHVAAGAAEERHGGGQSEEEGKKNGTSAPLYVGISTGLRGGWAHNPLKVGGSPRRWKMEIGRGRALHGEAKALGLRPHI